MTLDAQDIDQLATRLAQIIRPAPESILTLAEAIPYTKHESDDAFYRWCKRQRVKSVSHGRYSRPQLDVALQRESQRHRLRKAA